MFIYILSIAFQVSGALMLLLFSASVKRKNVIKRFHGKGLITKDNNTNTIDYDEDAFKEEFKTAYLSKISFGCIVLGYILGVFGEIDSEKKVAIAVDIIITTVIIMLISYGVVKCIISKKKSIKQPITEDELKELKISPDFENISNKDIDNFFNQ